MQNGINEFQQTRISIVVCTFNRQEMLRGALGSLTNLRTEPEFDYEVVVVDDGSTDETARVVHSVMDTSVVEIRYIRQENRGIAGARNTGVFHARGSWVAFFDDDELADPDWLVHLLAAAKSSGADCVGGPALLQLPRQSGAILPQTIRRLLGENPVMREQLPEGRWSVDVRRRQNAMPGTGNALVRRDLFDRIGCFSDVQRYGEDLQFFRRAQKCGARFASAPNAIVHHVIPMERLAPEYLLSLAGKAGASLGRIDSEVTGTVPALWNGAMRLVHLVVWILPGLLVSSLLNDSSRILSKKCSRRFAIEYLAAVARNLRWKFAGPAC